MHENSTLKYFRNTTGIQLRPDVFDKSMLVNSNLTSVRVKEILCSPRLVVEGKVGKEAPKL